MTLNTTISRIQYLTDGVTDEFPIPFKIWAASDIAVYSTPTAGGDDVLLNFGSDYTLDIVTYPDSGNVIFVMLPVAGYTITIERVMPLVQELDLEYSGDFSSENIERALDIIVAELQTQRDRIDRALKFQVSTLTLNVTLPPINASVAGDFVAVTSDGLGFTYVSGVTPPSVPVTSFMTTLLDDPTPADAQATLEVLPASAFGALATTVPRGVVGVADFASTADNAMSPAVPMAVVGARPGDHVLVQGAAGGTILSTAGITLVGKCLINDIVQVQLDNNSGAVFDAANQAINILVIPFGAWTA